MGSLTRKITKRARGYQLVKDFLKKTKEQQEHLQNETVVIDETTTEELVEKESEIKSE